MDARDFDCVIKESTAGPFVAYRIALQNIVATACQPLKGENLTMGHWPQVNTMVLVN